MVVTGHRFTDFAHALQLLHQPLHLPIRIWNMNVVWHILLEISVWYIANDMCNSEH